MRHKYFLSFFIFCLLSYLFLGAPIQSYAINEPTKCSGTVIDLGFPKKLLSFSELSRPGTCGVKPTKIVVHTTWGVLTAEDQFDYFENKPEGRYASTQFVVGKAGEILQMTETLEDKVEIAWGVGGYNSSSISIEVGHNGDYDSRDDAPAEQYASLLELIAALMKAYSIPVGDVEYDTKNSGDSPGSGPIDESDLGIFGHYQLNPTQRSDPGQGFLRDIREDIKKGGPFINGNTTGGGGSRTSTSCWVTEVGDAPDEDKPVCQTGSGGTGLPGQPLPSNDPAQIKQVMCDQYDVCPTESKSNPPSQPWTLEELTALWNITQRIAASTTYKDILLGDATTVIEIQRIQHCPNCESWVNGLQAGIGTAGSTIPGSSLIYITDLAFGQPNTYLEWLYAHEIGHIAQFASSSSFSSVTNCGNQVSSYGTTAGENFADSVSLYMTNGEQAINYLGEQGNLKVDFPCIYNALKDNTFGGVEY